MTRFEVYIINYLQRCYYIQHNYVHRRDGSKIQRHQVIADLGKVFSIDAHSTIAIMQKWGNLNGATWSFSQLLNAPHMPLIHVDYAELRPESQHTYEPEMINRVMEKIRAIVAVPKQMLDT